MVSWAAPVTLAGILAWAGGLKLADRQATAESFASLGLPAPGVSAVAVPVIELAIAVTLLVAPVAGGLAALVLLVGFSVFLAIHLVIGTEEPCACFGRARPSPISGRDLARNGLLGVLAALSVVL